MAGAVVNPNKNRPYIKFLKQIEYNQYIDFRSHKKQERSMKNWNTDYPAK